MKHLYFFLLIFVHFFPICAHTFQLPQTSVDEIVLETEDGLKLYFDDNKKSFSRIALGRNRFPLSDIGERFWGISWRKPPDSSWSHIKDATSVQFEYEKGEAGGGFRPFKPSTLRVDRMYKPANLKVSETWTANRNNFHLRVDLSYIQPVDEEQAVEARLQMPINFPGGKWYHHLDSAENIQPDRIYSTTLTRGVDIGTSSTSYRHLKSDLPFNLNGLNYIATNNYGLGVGIDPTVPTAYFVHYQSAQQILYASFHLGINPHHVTYSGQTFFGLNIFMPENPHWGMRDALEKYYDIYSEEFDPVDRTGKKGMLVGGGNYNPAFFPDHTEYKIDAFWQNAHASYTSPNPFDVLYYNIPSFFLDRGAKFKYFKLSPHQPIFTKELIDQNASIYLDLLRDYEAYKFRGIRDNPFSETCTHEVFSDCNTINGTTYLYGPVRLTGLSGYYSLQPYQHVDKNYQLNLYGHYYMAEPIHKSLLQNPDGTYNGAVTSFGYAVDTTNKTARMYINGLNPEPGITYDATATQTTTPVVTNNFGQLSIENTKRAVGIYGGVYQSIRINNQLLDFNGAAVDVVGAYLREDYKPDLKNMATYPLAYHPTTGKVVALEHLGLAAYLTKLREALGNSRPIAVNGLPISGFLFNKIDYVIAEAGLRDGIHEAYTTNKEIVLRKVNRYRMAANKRSITFWFRFNETAQHPDSVLDVIQTVFPQYTAKGIYLYVQRVAEKPYFFDGDTTLISNDIKHYYKNHIETVYTLNQAGWEPVSYTTSSDSNILIERFGKKYITLFNPGSDTQFDLIIRKKWIGLGNTINLTDFETGQNIPFSGRRNIIEVKDISLKANSYKVLYWQLRK